MSDTSITVYKMGIIPLDEKETEQQGNPVRSWDGIISLYAARTWTKRYWRDGKLEDGAHPFFVFREFEDALAYYKYCRDYPHFMEIWQAETSQLIKLPSHIPMFQEHWEHFWAYWLFDGILSIPDDLQQVPPKGTVVVPDITLIRCVYPVPEKQEGEDSE